MTTTPTTATLMSRVFEWANKAAASQDFDEQERCFRQATYWKTVAERVEA